MAFPHWHPKDSRFISVTALLVICIFLFHHNYLLDQVGLRSISQERPPSRIPKDLWYKLGPKGLNDDTRRWTDSCIRNNRDHNIHFIDESSADAYVRDAFGATRPDLVETYLGLSVPIFKADILRYLLLFTEGGIYLDLDVSCEAPISTWIPPQQLDSVSLVVGWEFDVGWGTNFVREFATWTMMAKPGSPHIWMVIEDILHGLRHTMKERDVPVEELTMQMVGDVVDATGPRRFTRSILKSVEDGFNVTLGDIQEIREPKLAGDVLVLPGWAFAASMNSYEEGVVVPPPLVVHHFAGSWKNKYGGEMSQ